ncbi:cell wall metabolism sensor histidine kinase WalK [Paenibacillus sp. OV219]|uniref:sensor histidine kinase n=1 Tax=Paenibacillus sp. OV219 TaxID=1884377 RepID=UPI0008D44B1D|nr:HAMP domain-containing sensor histidine kinase [Paenibacillus sp. OV219]SEM55650.1 His Kinase A (phospho-acceptor) domain-containing protein [Paenibacillus sp. OV219]
MFNKLRNRFLLMNMIIISFIMLAAFGTIYAFTYRNVQNDIHMDIRRMADVGKMNGGGPKDDHPKMDGNFPKDFHEPSLSFSIRTDKGWNITHKESRFELDSDLYTTAVKKAEADPAEFGQFTTAGSRWAYTVASVPSGYVIYYMDVTPQHSILTTLTYTFSLVAVVMLGVIYLASRYFAGRSIAPVKEAFEKQKRFIADASHELKTPLAVINTNADVLLANGEDTINTQVKWLHHIKSETERMKTLTNDLLYLTQMDDARERMIQVPFDFSEAVESVILTMEAVIFEKELNLDYDIEPNLSVTGNCEQMKQVVMILLDNAIKYSNPNGSIQLALKRHQGHIQLSMTNTGPGIPADQIDKIFDRFYRGDASRTRKNGSYGLGLAIAKSIVEHHRGKIHAKSMQGEKTTFYVQLG